MTKINPFKKGDRVRRIKTGDLGTVIGAVQVKEDQFTTRRRRGYYNRYHDVQTASKGDWKIGVHWDWEKEKFGDKVPKVTDPEFSEYHVVQWQWHERHKRWILAKFLEPITSEIINKPKEKSMSNFYIAGTGSRELILDVDKRREVRDYVADLLTKAKEKHGDKLIVISGMAEGFDEALARAAIMADVPFTAAIPNSGYIEYYWGKTSMLKRDRMSEAQGILSKASEIVYVCDGIYGPDGRHSNFHRNEWMVDHADVVWVYNPTTRGTAQCYDYCKKVGKRAFIVDIDKKI